MLYPWMYVSIMYVPWTLVCIIDVYVCVDAAVRLVYTRTCSSRLHTTCMDDIDVCVLDCEFACVLV